MIITDLRLNLCALYAACYMAVDMNDAALRWAVRCVFIVLPPPSVFQFHTHKILIPAVIDARFVRDLRQTVFTRSGYLLFAEMDVIFRLCETMRCDNLLDDISGTLVALARSIPSVIFLKRRCDRLREGLQSLRSNSFMLADALDFTRRDPSSFACHLKSSEQLAPLTPDDYLAGSQPSPFRLPQPYPDRPYGWPSPILGRYGGYPWPQEVPLHPYSKLVPTYPSPSPPASPDSTTQPSTPSTPPTTTTTQQESLKHSSSYEVEDDHTIEGAKNSNPPHHNNNSPALHSSSLCPSPNILAQLQHLHQQIEQQNKAAAAAADKHTPPPTWENPDVCGHNSKIIDPANTARPPSRGKLSSILFPHCASCSLFTLLSVVGKSNIYDLLNHDDDDDEAPDNGGAFFGKDHQHASTHNKDNTPPRPHFLVRQDDPGLSNPLRQGSGEFEERRCLECNATDTPEWRKGPGGPHTYAPLFPESFPCLLRSTLTVIGRSLQVV